MSKRCLKYKITGHERVRFSLIDLTLLIMVSPCKSLTKNARQKGVAEPKGSFVHKRHVLFIKIDDERKGEPGIVVESIGSIE